MVTFHTHARFGHNAELKKLFSTKNKLEMHNCGHVILYFISCGYFFQNTFIFQLCMALYTFLFENSQFLAVFRLVIFTNPPSYPHLLSLDKSIILL